MYDISKTAMELNAPKTIDECLREAKYCLKKIEEIDERINKIIKSLNFRIT